MAEFTSSAMVSPFSNALGDMASGALSQKLADNALLVQQHQQAVGATDMAVVGQAAASLLNMSEPDAAAAYGPMMESLKAQGFAKYAPSEYPGHAAAQALVQRSMTLPQQFQSGYLTAPGVAEALKAAGAPLPGQPGYGGGQPGQGGGGGGGGGGQASLTPFVASNLPQGVTAAEDQLVRTVIGEAAGEPLAGQQAVAHVIRNRARIGNQDTQSVIFAPNQFEPWNNAATRAKLEAIDPTSPQYQQILNNVVRPVFAGQAQDPTGGATHFYSPTAQAALGRPPPAWSQGGNRTTIGRHDFFYPGYSAPQQTAQATQPPAPGTTTTATAPPGQPGVQVGGTPPPPPGWPAGAAAPTSSPSGPGGFAAALAPPAVAAAHPPPAPGQRVSAIDAIQAGRLNAQSATPASAMPMMAGPGAGGPEAQPLRPVEPGWGTGAPTGYGGGSPPPGTVAPAPAPVAPVAPARPPPAQPAPSVATGVNSSQYQQAMELQRRAEMLDQVVDPTGRTKAMAAALRERAGLILKTDTFQDIGGGMQRNVLTGETKYNGPPTARSTTDNAGNTWVLNPGQPPTLLHANVSGVTGSGDDASALRILNEVAPKIANGTATPQDLSNYASAADVYRKPTTQTDPITKQIIRVNARELPAGFPVPPGTSAPGGSTPLTPGLSPSQQEIERDPAAYKVAEQQYTGDAPEARSLAEAGRQAQADQVRIHEMQDVLKRFSTGPGTEWRTAASAFLQRWAPSAISGWEKESDNLSGAEAAQAFSKLALVGAGTQERGVLGARGGYQAIKLFKEANPNVDLQDATNKSILDMQMISNQANQDYTQAALSHFADNEKRFATTRQYDSLNQFDRNWNAQRNPQVYSAAMGAISGQPAAQWTKGLSDDEYSRALQIVQRANPSAVVQTKNGPYSMQPNSVTTGTSGAPGTKVIRFDHNGNVIP